MLLLQTLLRAAEPGLPTPAYPPDPGLGPWWTIAISVTGAALATGLLNIIDHRWIRRDEDQREAKRLKREATARTRERLAPVIETLTNLGQMLAMRHGERILGTHVAEEGRKLEGVRFNVEDTELRALLEKIVGLAARFIQNAEVPNRAEHTEQLETMVEQARTRLAALMND